MTARSSAASDAGTLRRKTPRRRKGHGLTGTDLGRKPAGRAPKGVRPARWESFREGLDRQLEGFERTRPANRRHGIRKGPPGSGNIPRGLRLRPRLTRDFPRLAGAARQVGGQRSMVEGSTNTKLSCPNFVASSTPSVSGGVGPGTWDLGLPGDSRPPLPLDHRPPTIDY